MIGIIRAGSPWRLLPTNFPPWEAVYQQTQRWIKAGCFEAMVHDLRALLRNAEGRRQKPTKMVVDSRTLQSTPESGGEDRAGYDGAKRKKGSKLHIHASVKDMAVDTLGHLLALLVTPADEQDRKQVDALCEKVQEVTGQTVEVAYVDQVTRLPDDLSPNNKSNQNNQASRGVRSSTTPSTYQSPDRSIGSTRGRYKQVLNH